MTTYRNDTNTGLETQSKLIWYNLFWEVGGVSRVQSTDFDLFLCVGADRSSDVSTRRLVRECSLPWHVWIDSRTSVKCVKDARCIEGALVDISLDCRFAFQRSLVRLQITFVCDECRILRRFCVCVSEHMVCDLPLICVCFYFIQCPEAPCPAGTFNNVSSCVQGGKGRGGGSSCSCTTCLAGEMIDIDIPFFFIHALWLCVHKCYDQKCVVPSVYRRCVCVLIHVGALQASSTVQAYICFTPALHIYFTWDLLLLYLNICIYISCFVTLALLLLLLLCLCLYKHKSALLLLYSSFMYPDFYIYTYTYICFAPAPYMICI